MKNIDIFTKIDEKDKFHLLQKAANAALFLEIFFALALVTFIGLSAIIFYGIFSGIIYKLDNIPYSVSTIVYFLIAMLLYTIIMTFYLNSIRKKLKNNTIPSLIPPYIFIAFYIATSVVSFITQFEITALVAFIIALYLWYVLISCITKAKNLVRL